MALDLIFLPVKKGLKAAFNKGRDRLAGRLDDGDTFQLMVRDLINRDVNKIKDTLEAQKRKDLVDGIDRFREGVIYTFEGASDESDGPPRKKRKTELTPFLEEDRVTAILNNEKKLSKDAEKSFDEARDKVQSALADGTLSKIDRILATYIKIEATLITKKGNLAKTFEVCIKDLKNLHSHVEQNFKTVLEKRKRNRKSELADRDIVWSVCRLNRFLFDIAQELAGDMAFPGSLFIWPCVKYTSKKQKKEIDPLRDPRLDKVFDEEEKKLCSVVQYFGQKKVEKSNEQPKLKSPSSIAAIAEGPFLVLDSDETKMFDNTGEYLVSLPLSNDAGTRYHAVDVDVDENSNVYVLVLLVNDMVNKNQIRVFDKEGKETKDFELHGKKYKDCKLAVNKTNVFVLNGECGRPHRKIEVYEPKDGKFAGYLGESSLVDAEDIACGKDGLIFVLDKPDNNSENKCIRKLHKTNHSLKKSFRVADGSVAMAFHRASGYIVVVSKTKEGNLLLSY